MYSYTVDQALHHLASLLGPLALLSVGAQLSLDMIPDFRWEIAATLVFKTILVPPGVAQCLCSVPMAVDSCYHGGHTRILFPAGGSRHRCLCGFFPVRGGAPCALFAAALMRRVSPKAYPTAPPERPREPSKSPWSLRGEGLGKHDEWWHRLPRFLPRRLNGCIGAAHRFRPGIFYQRSQQLAPCIDIQLQAVPQGP